MELKAVVDQRGECNIMTEKSICSIHANVRILLIGVNVHVQVHQG